MRNQEAARYARWAAMSAAAIALIVAGFYGERALRGYIARRHGPAPVPEAVHQQFGGVSYSFSNQDGTTFTIRASHATQFKEGDKALLQDVWVTIYGKKGNRNDNIHTRECSYQPDAGNVQCTGDVEIDMQGATNESGGSAEQASATTAGGPSTGAAGEPSSTAAAGPVHVTTSNVTFNRESGEASTSAPVNLKFPGGEGRGVGLQYNSKEATLRLQRDVSFSMAASQKTGGLPVNATAANLEFHRDDRAIALGGPVVMHQGDRQLTAERVSIMLDKQYHAQEISAEGNPVVSGNENGAAFTVSAEKFEGALDPNGTIQQVIADGNANASRKTPAGNDHFSAERVEFAMVPGRNLLQQMTASGGVSAQTTAGANVRTLKTSALQIHFAAPANASGNSPAMNRQTIESAETLGPATIESKTSNQALDLKAAKFAAQFGPDGKLQKLLGHSGVEITRTPANGEPQSSTAKELVATFAPGGDWATVDESGGVRLTQDGKVATAGRARVTQATDTITLEGSPVFSDGLSRTSAGAVTINQKTGEIKASGGVISTEMAQSGANQRKSSTSGASQTGISNIALGEGDAHISGDALTGSINAGDVTFRGHARLWQGQAVLQADQISVSQKDGKLEATGNVVAVFPQAPGEALLPISAPAKQNTAASAAAKQTVWQVRAQKLTFSSEASAAHLVGDVTASSDQGSLHSATMDVYLAPPGASQKGLNNSAFGGRGVERAVAQGGVIVSQNGFHGYAQEAEYDAARGKFVFTGGQPRITDGNGNTTTGHSLTFDVASDTISVDSEEGSRTLTRHRVEK